MSTTPKMTCMTPSAINIYLTIEFKYHRKKIYANNVNIYINIIPAVGLHVK